MIETDRAAHPRTPPSKPPPVAGVGARQGAQRHQPRHETRIAIRFTGPGQRVHRIEAGAVVPRLGCALEGFLHWPARDRENFTHGNPAVSFTRYGFFFSLWPRPKRGVFIRHGGTQGTRETPLLWPRFSMNADSDRSGRHQRRGLPRLWRGGAEGGMGNPDRPLPIELFMPGRRTEPTILCR